MGGGDKEMGMSKESWRKIDRERETEKEGEIFGES